MRNSHKNDRFQWHYWPFASFIALHWTTHHSNWNFEDQLCLNDLKISRNPEKNATPYFCEFFLSNWLLNKSEPISRKTVEFNSSPINLYSTYNFDTFCESKWKLRSFKRKKNCQKLDQRCLQQLIIIYAISLD